ncbi:MAG TPA: hypothetical protein VL096_12425 [Pirellulaceae bacterium]|nr:hypothetical protein [Pirellulaceae bacterium]
MMRNLVSGLLLACGLVGMASAQAPKSPGVTLRPIEPATGDNVLWRSPKKGITPTALRSEAPPATAPITAPTAIAPAPITPASKPPVAAIAPSPTRVTSGTGQLPTDRGQVWREYDISPYTLKVTSTEKPEQAIVDWILRETGADSWFTGTVCLMNADKQTLRVYHTPEMQRVVADIVDRFVVSQAETYSLGLRLATVGSPNWRSKFHTLLRPVTVQSPGVEAWLLPKESASMLLGELRKRTDYREQNAPSVSIQNGQSQTVAQTRLKSYARNVRLKEAYPYFDVENGQINEGYSLQLSPLYSTDSTSLDVVLKCHIDQLEKLVPVSLEVPAGPGAPAQRVQIQVPQLVSWRLHERFRFPADQVLLLSCGVVASPTGEKVSALGIPGLVTGPGRADALLFIESHGVANAVLPEPPRPVAAGILPNTRGRY